MKIQTFSIIAGSPACNARCPFCVSKMTPPAGTDWRNLTEPQVNWRNFEVACRFAKQNGATTAMFTGKGEPTLFPDQITKFLKAMQRHEFPLIEIQTNGIRIMEKDSNYGIHLAEWHKLGMTTVAISIVHYDPAKNKEIYLPYKDKYIDLPILIEGLHNLGFSVRLTCIGASGFIDSPEELNKLLAFAKFNKVEQTTFTPVNKPAESRHQEAWQWAQKHHLTEAQRHNIRTFVENGGDHILTLGHGAKVYDLDGQNLCLNECLTNQPDNEEIRNLIFFPDGHLRYSWEFEGAIIL